MMLGIFAHGYFAIGSSFFFDSYKWRWREFTKILIVKQRNGIDDNRELPN